MVAGSVAAGSADVPSRRTQEERRREAEQRLLRAAAVLIAENGAQRTTLAAIGEAAGYSRGLANHHFGSKTVLIERLATLTQERFASAAVAAAGGDDELETLLSVLRAYLDGVRTAVVHGGRRTDPFTRAFFVMWGESAHAAADLRPVFAAGDARSREQFGDLIRAGQAHGLIRADVDAPAAAAALLGQLRGIVLQVLVEPRLPGLDAITETVLDGARRLLTA